MSTIQEVVLALAVLAIFVLHWRLERLERRMRK